MKHIKINIPDNLSKQEEIILLSKKLTQKALSGNGKDESVRRIGTQMDVQELQTTIIINRVSSEKPIEMVTCNVCGCEYPNNTAKYFWQNYGGKKTKVAVCSDDCVNLIVDFLGDRAAISKHKLKPLNFFNSKRNG